MKRKNFALLGLMVILVGAILVLSYFYFDASQQNANIKSDLYTYLGVYVVGGNSGFLHASLEEYGVGNYSAASFYLNEALNRLSNYPRSSVYLGADYARINISQIDGIFYRLLSLQPAMQTGNLTLEQVAYISDCRDAFTFMALNMAPLTNGAYSISNLQTLILKINNLAQ